MKRKERGEVRGEDRGKKGRGKRGRRRDGCHCRRRCRCRQEKRGRSERAKREERGGDLATAPSPLCALLHRRPDRVPVITSCRYRRPGPIIVAVPCATVAPQPCRQVAAQSHQGRTLAGRERRRRRGSRRRQICLAPPLRELVTAVDLLYRRTELWKEGSEHYGKGRRLPSLSRRQSRVSATNRRRSGCRKPPPSLYLFVKVAVGPLEFLVAVGAAAGSARDCGCSILFLLIELPGLSVAIRAVSAIAEVSRPAIEAAVDSGRR
ncbi:uncharacterized protein [Arachis hypogaea]|uniref:uncharacterized protein n=1 Tax=Arachis hypogaea TaxID=3818 RepID=UPI000DEC7122|nr:uncharacterized protein LOC112794678 [Arachis hypogaea]